MRAMTARMPRPIARLSFCYLILILLPAAAPSDGTAESARDWLAIFCDHLQHNVLQFWVDHAVDHQYGGLLGHLNRKGEPIPPGDKSVVLISRSMWSFAEAYRRYPDPAYQRLAGECLKFLREHMWDKEHGGYYFQVTQDGKIIDSTNEMLISVRGRTL